MGTVQWEENKNCVKVLSRNHTIKTWCSDWTSLGTFAQTRLFGLLQVGWQQRNNGCYSWAHRLHTDPGVIHLKAQPQSTTIKYDIKISKAFLYNFKFLVFKIFWISNTPDAVMLTGERWYSYPLCVCVCLCAGVCVCVKSKKFQATKLSLHVGQT